jgi:hypothetical protein
MAFVGTKGDGAFAKLKLFQASDSKRRFFRDVIPHLFQEVCSMAIPLPTPQRLCNP